MKNLLFATFLMLGAVWGANQEQQNPKEMYQNMKKMMAPAFEQMLPIYDDLKKCYQKESSKKNYVHCTKTYGPKIEKVLKTMLGGQKSIIPSDKELEAFAWTKEVHKKTLQSLQKVSTQMKKIHECLKSSKDMEAFSRCTKPEKKSQ